MHLATQLHLNGGDDSQQGIAPALPYQPPSWGQRRLSMRRYNKAMHDTSDLMFVRVFAFLRTLDVCELQQVAGQQIDADGENVEGSESQATQATKEAFDIAFRTWTVPSLKGAPHGEEGVEIDDKQLK